MTKLLKTLITLGVGFATVTSTVSISYADTDTKTQTTQAIAKEILYNQIIAQWIDQNNKQNVILLSDIKPYLPKGVKTPTQQQIEKATESYVVTQLKNYWEQRAKNEVKVSSTEVDAFFAEKARENGLTSAQLMQELRMQGVNISSLRTNITNMILKHKRDEFLRSNLQGRLDEDKIQTEGFQGYEQAKKDGKLATIKTPDLSYILVEQTPVFSEKQAQAKAQDIYNKIVSGKTTFAQAAKQYSDDIVSAAQGGKLGKLSDLPDNEAQAIFNAMQKAKPGSTLKPIYVKDKGYLIVRYNNDVDTEADLNYYLNKAYQEEVSKRSNIKSLEDFLLSSVVIKYIPLESK